VAKATTNPAASAKDRGKQPARPAGRDARSQRPQQSGETAGTGSYFASVVSELRKTTWPTVPDLMRMTQVVIATVIMFALLIGGFDFILGYIAKPLYSQQGTSAPTVTAPPVPTLRPAASPTPSANAATSPAASSGTSTAHATGTP
jgi:preprotein translocase subunit SecE